MPWTKNLLPALGPSWHIEEAGTVAFEDGFVAASGNSSQIYSDRIIVDKELIEIKVIMRYRRMDDSLLSPHDNPCLPKISALFSLYPMQDTEAEEDEQLYMQNITVYAAQSYVGNKLYKKSTIPDNYCLVKVSIPVDAKIEGVHQVICNVFMNAPCRLYALVLQGKYAE